MLSLPSAPLLPVPSHPLPFPQPYHIPPDSPAPTLLYSPFCYSSLASPPQPTYPRTPILPLHSLPSAPLASPPLSPTLPYHIHPDRSRGRNVSFPTSSLTIPYSTLPSTTVPTPPTQRFPSTSYLSTPLPSHPIHSAHFPCPNTLFYCTLHSPPPPSPSISCLLPPPLIPSPSVPYAPISSGLPCSTQKSRKSQRPTCFGTRMYRSRNCLVQNVFWRTEMTLSLIGPGNV